MNRSLAALVFVSLATPVAHANVEIGGTAGVHVFNEDNALGVENTPDAESLKNSALFALRFGVFFGSTIGIELEGGVIPTEPRKMVLDVYNAVYRAHLVAQFRAASAENKVIPFFLVGGGAIEVVDSANENIIGKDRDGMVYVGAGVKYRAQNNWGVRGDLRLIVVPSTSDGQTLDFEALLSVYREFGRPQKAAPVAVVKDEDPDKDGISGDADKCPTEPEDKDDFEDDNGCPDPDNDGDGVPDVSDKCPKEPEDKDNFEDDNGCPDPDNDADGVPDSADKCVDQPETKNGFEDEDGCPDEIPEAVKRFTGAIQGINFKVNSVDLAPGSDKVLDKAVAVLAEFKNIKLEIQGHTDDQPLAKTNKKFADNTALSQGRAETVKAYMVKKGIEESRLVAKGYGESAPIENPADLKGAKLNAARIKNRRVEFKLITNESAPEATPEPTPTPTPTPAPAPTPTPTP
ncbi:MAG: OmpA family protein [Deltaproteobacteria bacterium]|nr:OmpA family protein [Deltaproteobacteria bacterium]